MCVRVGSGTPRRAAENGACGISLEKEQASSLRGCPGCFFLVGLFLVFFFSTEGE